MALIHRSAGYSLTLGLLLLAYTAVPANATDWIEQMPADKPLEAFEAPTGDWTQAASVELNPQNPRLLAWKPGTGILVNGPTGRTRNLVTKQKFTDVAVHVEFLIPKGSNSGVKLMGLYEIQIQDSFGVKQPTGDDCGGIYPLAEEQPRYHHIDKGVPPRVNACKPAGEWQTLAIVFKAPRFDGAGKKTAHARFVKVVMNDQLIHENVDVPYPTGAAWRLRQELPTGPLFLQADHGPVAFRNVRIRPWQEESK